MAEAFETYLYQKYRAVYVSPLSQLATTLNLLDILMIKEDFVSGRRDLVLVGSMLDLGTESSVQAQNELLNERERFWNGQVSIGYTERKLFSWASADVPQLEEVISSKSSVTSSLLGGVAEAGVHFSKDREVKCKIGQVDTAKVDWQLLGNMVAKEPPKWQPDLTHWWIKPHISKPSWFGSSGVELWVVHQILYTNMVEVTSTDSSSAGGKVFRVLSKTPQTEGSESRNSGLEVTRETNGTQKFELVAAKSPASRVPDKFMFAFRVIGYKFDSTGKFISYREDPGDHRPIHRASENGESHDYQRAQICNLYTEPAPDFNSDENDSSDEDDDRSTKTLNLQRLLIVNNDGVSLDGVWSATSNSEGSTLDGSNSSILAVDNCY